MSYLNFASLIAAITSLIISVITLVERHRDIAVRRSSMGVPNRGLWDVIRGRDWYRGEGEPWKGADLYCKNEFGEWHKL